MPSVDDHIGAVAGPPFITPAPYKEGRALDVGGAFRCGPSMCAVRKLVGLCIAGVDVLCKVDRVIIWETITSGAIAYMSAEIMEGDHMIRRPQV